MANQSTPWTLKHFITAETLLVQFPHLFACGLAVYHCEGYQKAVFNIEEVTNYLTEYQRRVATSSSICLTYNTEYVEQVGVLSGSTKIHEWKKWNFNRAESLLDAKFSRATSLAFPYRGATQFN